MLTCCYIYVNCDENKGSVLFCSVQQICNGSKAHHKTRSLDHSYCLRNYIAKRTCIEAKRKFSVENTHSFIRSFFPVLLNFLQHIFFLISIKFFLLSSFLFHSFLKSGQQIRSKIDSFRNATFLIAQPNPMMLPLIGIVSERRFQ